MAIKVKSAVITIWLNQKIQPFIWGHFQEATPNSKNISIYDTLGSSSPRGILVHPKSAIFGLFLQYRVLENSTRSCLSV